MRWPSFLPAHWGIELFFALSGYLIAGEILALGRGGSPRPLQRFLLRRFFRTMPIYWSVLLAYALLRLGADAPARLAANALFLDTLPLFREGTRPLLPVSWSLAVEEQGYLLFALLGAALLILARHRPTVPRAPFAAVFFLLLILAGSALRARAIAEGAGLQTVKFSSLLQFDALAYGGLARLLLPPGRLRPPLGLVLALLATGLMVALAPDLRQHYLAAGERGGSSLSVYAVEAYGSSRVLCALAVGALASMPLRTLAAGRTWRYLVAEPAASSYSNYLLHFSFVLPLCLGWPGLPPLLRWLLFLAGSYGVAALSFRWLEQPWMDLRRRVLAMGAFSAPTLPRTEAPE
jgi:peptidoglycan/LPS O-acetylase OafA/YrhL